MTEDLVPIFTTHHSIGESIITADEFKKDDKIEANKPVSVLAIAKVHGQDPFLVVDTDISAYWKLYKGAKDLGLQLAYGIKLVVCADLHDKSEEGEKTESNIIVLFNNTQAYYDFVPIYSLASTTGMHGGKRRIDWDNLHKLWTDNLSMVLPFYSSFIARNLLVYNSRCMPDFKAIQPRFFMQSHGLPFDEIIKDGVERYTKSSGHGIVPAHQIYYYRDRDAMKHMTLQCLTNTKPGPESRKPTWDKPNLDHYGSDEFSYESYLRNIGKSL